MSNRIIWMDFARFFAIILVVFTHAQEQANNNDLTVGSLSIFYSIHRIGVPLFFLLTGSLVLTKLAQNYNNMKLFGKNNSVSLETNSFMIKNCKNVMMGGVANFYIKRIPQFFIVLVFYSVATNFIYDFLIEGSSFKEAIKTGLLKNGIRRADNGSAIQLWFLYTIIAIYLISPFLSVLLKHLTTKQILWFTILCLITGTVQTSFPGSYNLLLNRMGDNFLGSLLPYFIIGYLIQSRDIKLSTFYFKGIAVVILILTVLVVYFVELRHGFINSLHWYSTSFPLFISSTCVYLLIKSFNYTKTISIVTSVSIYSFGIFLSHYFFLYIIKYFYVLNFGDDHNFIFKLILFFFLPFICGYFFTKFFAKIPYLRRLVI